MTFCLVAIDVPRPAATVSRMTTVDRRALNRATLARQSLLERSTASVPEVLERLVGLQAQTTHSWYVGLWSRIEGFAAEDASGLLANRELVRMALMRSTIHLVTADDALALRPALGPAVGRPVAGAWARAVEGLDRDELLRAGAEVLERTPMTAAALGRELAVRWPDRDPAALALAVRAWLPLVQVTPRGLWGRSGQALHTTLRAWLGRDGEAMPLDELVRRYLAAFGPASVKDMQVWSGLTRLSEVFDSMRSDLVVLRDEQGVELFDLPDAPRPGEVPAPVRFLYDFDNLLLSHADRSRVVSEEYAAMIAPLFGTNIMPRAVLVDGVAAGMWTTDITKDTARLVVTTPADLREAVRGELADEGTGLLDFLAPGRAQVIDFTKPD